MATDYATKCGIAKGTIGAMLMMPDRYPMPEVTRKALAELYLDLEDEHSRPICRELLAELGQIETQSDIGGEG